MLAELTRLQQPSGVARHARHRYRRHERLPLLLPRARRDSAHFRDVLRPAHDDQLFPHRRTGAGASARLAEAREGFHRHLPRRASTNTKNCSPAIASGSAAPKASAIISLEDMLDLGVTGPMLRAAGVDCDIRKDAPVLQLRESSISKFRRAPKTTFTRAISCVSRRCVRA